MPIEVELPDGTIAEFPDGTDTATMERALAAYRSPTEQNRPPALLERPKPKRTAAQLTGVSDRALAPTTGMSTGQRALAGVGKAFADTGRGIKQLGAEGAMLGIGLQAGLMNRLGLDGNELVRRCGLPIQDAVNRMRQEEAERRQTDAPLMATPGGIAGNIGGYATQFLGPGIALRGSRVAPLLMPRTVGGNAAQGAGLGLLQPATDSGDRAMNVGLGGGAGALGSAVPAAVGAGVRRVSGKTLSGPQKRAGRAMLDALQGRPMTPVASATPGVNLTLGEATLDPGLLRIEDSLRINPETSASFTLRDLQNNQARAAALQGIAGDDAAMAAAMAAREQAAAPFYQAAQGAQVAVDEPLKASLSRLPPSVMSTARRLARLDGATFADDASQLTGQQLHYIKLAIDDALGRVGPGSLGNTERRALMGAKEDLVSNISRLIPEYGQGMQAFSAASPAIGRMQIGRELLNRGRAAQDDALGSPLLQPGRFGRAARELDQIAQSATGFSRASAANYLSPDDLGVIASINDDLRRQSARVTAPGGNSRTAARLLSEQSLTGRLGLNTIADALAKKVPVLGGVVDWWEDRTTRAALEELGNLFTSDPRAAQMVLSRLNPAQRTQVERALMSLGRSAAVAPALSE